MPAFLGNLSATEIFVVGIVAVLIFGKRLPEVASQTYGQIRKLRQGMEQFRKETGIDKELRSIEHTFSDLDREVRLDPRGPPVLPVAPRPLAAPPPVESQAPQTPPPAPAPQEPVPGS